MAITSEELRIILRAIDENSPAFQQLKANLQEVGTTTEQANESTAEFNQRQAEEAAALKKSSDAAEEKSGALKTLGGWMNTVKIGLGALAIASAAVVMAFKQVRQSADEIGRTDLVQKIDTATDRLTTFKNVLLEIPFAGAGVNTIMAEAANTAGMLSVVIADTIIQYKVFNGTMAEAEGQALRMKLALAETRSEMDKLKEEAAGSVAAFDKWARALGFAGNTAYLTASQIEYLNQRAAASGNITGVPGGVQGALNQTQPGSWGN